MKRPSLAVYTTTTVPYGYKQNLLQGFGLPIEKDGSFKKVSFQEKHNSHLQIIGISSYSFF